MNRLTSTQDLWSGARHFRDDILFVGYTKVLKPSLTFENLEREQKICVTDIGRSDSNNTDWVYREVCNLFIGSSIQCKK